MPLFWSHNLLLRSYHSIHHPSSRLETSRIDDDIGTITTANVKHESLRRPPSTRNHHRRRRQHYNFFQKPRSSTKSPSSGFDLIDFVQEPPLADAIVVGSGLAGLTATLTILDRGGTVMLLEKEPILGGNSNKASSGINACCFRGQQHNRYNNNNNDTLALFRDDTVRSAGTIANLPLIDTLVGESATALGWLRQRVGVDLSALVQLGGHSRRRTHRPQQGFVGAEIMSAMETAIRSYESSGRVSIQVDTQVQRIIRFGNKDSYDAGDDDDDDDDDGRVVGVISESIHGGYDHLRADHVILATGGFASDRTEGSYLEKFRPELLSFPATAGAFSTGDGIAMAEAIGASSRDMDKIQLHPTGFVDPTDRSNPNKVLAAEILRGVGGILLNHDGERFCNELGTRSYVTDRMLDENSLYATTKRWDRTSDHIPTFFLVLSSDAAQVASRHVTAYTTKGLLKQIVGVDGLAIEMNVPATTLRRTIETYRTDAQSGVDDFGKTVFENPPNEDDPIFFVGEVTPVLHYCMGGLTIDKEGNVMTEDGASIPGLYAAGEVTGGVHGNNRLGGNSLLECAVFGGIIGRKIPIMSKNIQSSSLSSPNQMKRSDDNVDEERRSPTKRGGSIIVTVEELSRHKKKVAVDGNADHNYDDDTVDCWVALYGKVYDLSQFAQHHPGGAKSILTLAGMDATHIFSNVHSQRLLDRIQNHLIGTLLKESDDNVDEESSESSSSSTTTTVSIPQSILRDDIIMEEVKLHNRLDDCWVVLDGTVYDLTDFQTIHPGGAYMIQKHAGKDGTVAFHNLHRDTSKFDGLLKQYVVGRMISSSVVVVT